MVLLFAEYSDGQFKKAVLEAATYACDLAKSLGTECAAVSVGQVPDEALKTLGNYGVSKVYKVANEKLNHFTNTAFAAAISSVAAQTGAKAVIFAQTYNGRAVAPRVSVKLDASAFSGVIQLPDTAKSFANLRLAFSGKGVEEVAAAKEKVVITVKTNAVSDAVISSIISSSLIFLIFANTIF